ncbi:hypothetical protein SOMG_04139 [Schizosaccharomyces osmophilus]|uniref:Transmembrane protein n=1 Tax=Schizosaccharomyces osmophilus TaxID=2545709 RepID=A0AAE9WG54_9SCHI|nr:uncharacterized protein SOMG_04139 [Schizosaccharomyces osmophilus]WBW75054.1 hypothetical protein SOMG_04139 [Schizosaccharomyces osmophilus]
MVNRLDLALSACPCMHAYPTVRVFFSGFAGSDLLRWYSSGYAMGIYCGLPRQDVFLGLLWIVLYSLRVRYLFFFAFLRGLIFKRQAVSTLFFGSFGRANSVCTTTKS